MSDSPDSTAPNTSEGLIEESTNANAFATLRPVNRTARIAFDAVVTATNKYPKYEQRRQFLSVERRRSLPTSVFTEDEEEEDISSPVLWQGAYTFSLGKLPRDPTRWEAGNGDSADLLLAPLYAKRKVLDLASRHVAFILHAESCRLVLIARHKVTVARAGARVIN